MRSNSTRVVGLSSSDTCSLCCLLKKLSWQMRFCRQSGVSTPDRLVCSTWKSLWKAGLGMLWTLKMSFCLSLSPFCLSSSPFSTNIMESMRESTADNWESGAEINNTTRLHNIFFFGKRNVVCGELITSTTKQTAVAL